MERVISKNNTEQAREVGEQLRSYRLRAGKSQGQLGKDIGLDRSNICAMEKGIAGITPARLKMLAAALNLSQEEAESFGKRAAPALQGLDPVWLAENPPEKRGGLALRALRTQAGKPGKELAETIYVSPGLVRMWEIGSPIAPHYYEAIQSALNASDEDMRLLKSTRLSRTTEKAAAEKKPSIAMSKVTATQAGAAYAAAAVPELKPSGESAPRQETHR